MEQSVAVSAGLYHSFATGEAGGSMAWGFNGLGQLGNGNTIDQHRPVWVSFLPQNYSYYQLSAGGFHSLGVGVQAQFAATGWNAFTQVNARGGDSAGFIQPVQFRWPTPSPLAGTTGSFSTPMALSCPPDGTDRDSSATAR